MSTILCVYFIALWRFLIFRHNSKKKNKKKVELSSNILILKTIDAQHLPSFPFLIVGKIYRSISTDYIRAVLAGIAGVPWMDERSPIYNMLIWIK